MRIGFRKKVANDNRKPRQGITLGGVAKWSIITISAIGTTAFSILILPPSVPGVSAARLEIAYWMMADGMREHRFEDGLTACERVWEQVETGGRVAHYDPQELRGALHVCARIAKEDGDTRPEEILANLKAPIPGFAVPQGSVTFPTEGKGNEAPETAH